MELRHIYILAKLVNDEIGETLPEDARENMEILVTVSPTTFLGIDKEFYFLTHDKSYEGFHHTNEEVNANIDGVKFKIVPSQKKKK